MSNGNQPNQSNPFDFAHESVKQAIALATGIITVSIAFLKDIFQNSPSDAAKVFLALSYVFFLGSLLFGLLALLGFVTVIKAKLKNGLDYPGLRGPASFQFISLFLGIACTVIMAIILIFSSPDNSKQEPASATNNYNYYYNCCDSIYVRDTIWKDTCITKKCSVSKRAVLRK